MSLIVIARNAEVPAGKPGPNLSMRGRTRAFALVGGFVSEFGQLPNVIYTCQEAGSLRCLQTVTPLYQVCDGQSPLKPNFAKAEVARAVNEMSQHEKALVLVCWEAEYIPAMVQALGFGPEQCVPNFWPKEHHDRYWAVFTKNSDGVNGSFRDVPQRLLFGDSLM